MAIRYEVFREDTIYKMCEHLNTVMLTIDLTKVYSITTVPLVADGVVLGWETTILWNDTVPYVR